MKRPLFGRPVGSSGEATQRAGERGVTIALVALAMMAIMAVAALSVDVVTLYLANAEAQRSADAAALAAARILSISGMTGDPSNNGGHWTNACAAAVQVATAVAQHNRVGSTAGTVNVSFPNNSDCTSGGSAAAFGVNPLVTVQVRRTNLPIFFARIWGQREATVGATATAEAFNSSNSDVVGNGGAAGNVIPVQPRCVKPWIVPNLDPGNPPGCTGATCSSFVGTGNGSISTAGIRIGGTAPGIVGEQFSLFADCQSGTSCTLETTPQPQANVTSGTNFDGNGPPAGNNLEYVPGDVPSTSSAFPSCGHNSPYQKAVAGCDQTTAYQCGVPTPGNTVDLSENPGGPGGDTATAVQCLIHQGATGGQDTLDNTVFPFKISAGSLSPLGISGQITSSSSIVSLPIYDNTAPGGVVFPPGGTTQVTIVGFLQVFINSVSTTDGSLNVTVLNVSGCGNGGVGSAPVGTAVTGTSPVPVRLITYP